MTDLNFKGKKTMTSGELPPIGSLAPDFYSTKTDLSTCSLSDFKEQCVLIDVYPSIETEICFKSVKKFQNIALENPNIAVLCLSMDLPFTLRRVEKGEDFQNVILLSDFRNREFGDLFGLTIINGPLAGLLARAVIILDKHHRIVYHELVQDISNPPNYRLALKSLKSG